MVAEAGRKSGVGSTLVTKSVEPPPEPLNGCGGLQSQLVHAGHQSLDALVDRARRGDSGLREGMERAQRLCNTSDVLRRACFLATPVLSGDKGHQHQARRVTKEQRGSNSRLRGGTGRGLFFVAPDSQIVCRLRANAQ